MECGEGGQSEKDGGRKCGEEGEGEGDFAENRELGLSLP